MKVTSFFSVLALTLCLTTTSFAQKQNDDKKMPPKPEQTADKGMPCMDKGMPCGKQENLFTDEQKEAFKTIRLESMKESRPLEDQLRELRTHQQTLMHADKPDLNAINANIDKISDIENQLAKIKAKARVEMMSKLTDEQKMQMPHFPGMDGPGMMRQEGPGMKGPKGPDMKDMRMSMNPDFDQQAPLPFPDWMDTDDLI